jgi:conjugal transfer mating pair stabilization protein TraN
MKVSRDCWEWGYSKTCAYPSKNDCRLYSHCYFVRDAQCLLRDSIGNCVNQKQEFSCEAWDYDQKNKKIATTGFSEKEGKKETVCLALPCMDGNCFDKSYDTNGEMMDALSKLHAASKTAPDKNGNFNLFVGSSGSCSKKPTEYQNCCMLTDKGWGRNLGAKCSKDEHHLRMQRERNLCVKAGTSTTKKVGVTVVTKHHFCCFTNLLEKAIQVSGRAQLGKSFWAGNAPDCSGFTLDEINQIDWSAVDFSEFIDDMKQKFKGSYKAPTEDELKDGMIESQNKKIRKPSEDELNPDNNLSGWNTDMKID